MSNQSYTAQNRHLIPDPDADSYELVFDDPKGTLGRCKLVDLASEQSWRYAVPQGASTVFVVAMPRRCQARMSAVRCELASEHEGAHRADIEWSEIRG